MKTKALALTAGLFLAVSAAHAQDKVGTATAQFLKVGVSARAVGMGDATVAATDDASGLYYNPASITAIPGGEAVLSHIDLYHGAGVSYEFAGVVLPTYVASGRVGISFQALRTDDMPETTPLDPTGTGRNFRSSEYGLAGTYALDLTDKFSAGFTFRFVSSFLADLEPIRDEPAVDASARSWGIDIGTLYRTGYHGINFGMAISNFGPDLIYLVEAAPLPINFKVGVAADLFRTEVHALQLAAEGSHPNDNRERANVGAEYTLRDWVALRGGYRFRYDDETWSVGGGVYLADGAAKFDYAYTAGDILPDVHRYSLGIRF
ncbi:MAG: hypothetical protein CME06_10695 [Gemmatimonadetes bacterium]|nr:hypothetical protein [Gemmatimonadota bacterium]